MSTPADGGDDRGAGMSKAAHEQWQALDGTVDDPPEVLVHTHPALCCGWGNCHRWAPDAYPLDEQGHIGVHRMHVPPEHAEDAYWGAQACPEHAITVIGPPEEFWKALRSRRSAERLAAHIAARAADTQA